jgi:Ca2+-transporting ATPase
MGITGTDVAKGAADMTLTDDNFATIVDAVKEGRGIYANLRKVVGFLLGTNISEVISVFVAMMVSGASPFLSMQLLWINLVGDSLPAIALGMEPIEKGIMNEKPKHKNEGLFAHGLGFKITFSGILFSVLALAGFYIGCGQVFGLGAIAEEKLAAGRTMAFMILALSQSVHTYNMRSEHSLFSIGMFSNKYVNLATLAAVALMSLVLFTPLNTIFGLVYLDWKLYLIAVGLILVPLVVMEIYKLVQLLVRKAKEKKDKI